MSEIVAGRKDIIEYLRPIMSLSMDQKTAWRKICRWRKAKKMDVLFHRLPGQRPFLIREEVELWFQEYDEYIRGDCVDVNVTEC